VGDFVECSEALALGTITAVDRDEVAALHEHRIPSLTTLELHAGAQLRVRGLGVFEDIDWNSVDSSLSNESSRPNDGGRFTDLDF
jgi:hypothetical protein